MQQGERRAGGVEQPLDECGGGAGGGLAVHGGGSFQERRNGRRKSAKAAPRAAFAECGMCARISGPPDERSTTSSCSQQVAYTWWAPYRTVRVPRVSKSGCRNGQLPGTP
ncbi:hypothetical protein Stube_50830 [Streptomyces tubercidicus]|uniref:Uncharacterized protein n=1 Tax=Streptomyces tubercidicus TaxID=47759 RepID=A0A640UYV5_9ACTN|nr:hypothetical protein Stube_50830 [Streptomyces tubercidicus]